jgi:hypothetical protein
MYRTTEDIAAAVWEELYPDRRPWSDLEPETKAEWTRFIKVTTKHLFRGILTKSEAP